MNDVRLSMRGIVKRFGSFTALDHVDLDVRAGTVHALLGENGAGKSTLMNILYGMFRADEGDIFIDGEAVRFSSPRDAIEHKIGMVHQHFMLIDSFTAAENIVLGAEPRKGLFLDTQLARSKAAETAERYGLGIDPDALIADMSVGMQQRVEILKALHRGADILILDEPTAVLTPAESLELERVMRSLAANGKSIIIITHKLKEIERAADECTVIRRGKYIGTVDIAAARCGASADIRAGSLPPGGTEKAGLPACTPDSIGQASVSNITYSLKTESTAKKASLLDAQLASMMVGRNVDLHINVPPSNPGRDVLVIRDLSVGTSVHAGPNRQASVSNITYRLKTESTAKKASSLAVRSLSLTVRAGEIVGIAGVDGSGQKELVEAIMNLTHAPGGTISIDGREIQNMTPADTIAAGVAVIHEDRLKRGLVGEFTCAENSVIEEYNVSPYADGSLLNDAAVIERLNDIVAKYDIRPEKCADLPARALSGGNQQKLIIGRETARQPALLIAMQPTRGIDVGAIEIVRRALIAQRDKGTAVLLISYDLDEVMEMSDMLAVMHGGEIADISPHGARDENEVGLLMAGGRLS